MTNVRHPLFKTLRFDLVEFNEAYISDDYISWLNDKFHMRYSEQRHYSHSHQSCVDFFNKVQAEKALMLACIFREEGLHIGNIVVRFDTNNGIADLSILLSNKLISHGILHAGTELWCAIIPWLFNNFPIRKLTAGTMSSNIKMKSLCQRAGMKLEGKFKNHLLLDKQPEDVLFYSIFRPGNVTPHNND